jgi:hypothetical protein
VNKEVHEVYFCSAIEAIPLNIHENVMHNDLHEKKKKKKEGAAM